MPLESAPESRRNTHYALLFYAETWQENPIGRSVHSDGTTWEWLPSWLDTGEVRDFPTDPKKAGEAALEAPGIAQFTVFSVVPGTSGERIERAVRSRDRWAMLGYDAEPLCPSNTYGETKVRLFAEKAIAPSPNSPHARLPWGRGFLVVLSRPRTSDKGK